ncbi:unnamed protein product, partial [Ectocarpus sp. 4 AP-2014]
IAERAAKPLGGRSGRHVVAEAIYSGIHVRESKGPRIVNGGIHEIHDFLSRDCVYATTDAHDGISCPSKRTHYKRRCRRYCTSMANHHPTIAVVRPSPMTRSM